MASNDSRQCSARGRPGRCSPTEHITRAYTSHLVRVLKCVRIPDSEKDRNSQIPRCTHRKLLDLQQVSDDSAQRENSRQGQCSSASALPIGPCGH